MTNELPCDHCGLPLARHNRGSGFPMCPAHTCFSAHLSERIAVLEGENALMRQAVDSAIVQKMETHTHGGLTEFGEGGLATLKSIQREFDHASSRASLIKEGSPNG